MKKNKTIAYALAATLLVGGTFAGTKAWFTDKEEAYNDLVITMGNLNVDVDEGEWSTLNDNTEASNTGSKDVFANVKPGDRFIKTITITNNGSLAQKLTVDGGNLNEKLPSGINVGSNLSELTGKVLQPGESIEAGIGVDVLTSVGGEFGDNDGLNLNEKAVLNFNELMSPFVINADQPEK